MHNDYRHCAVLLAAQSLILLSLETLPCHILKVQPSILILYTFCNACLLNLSAKLLKERVSDQFRVTEHGETRWLGFCRNVHHKSKTANGKTQKVFWTELCYTIPAKHRAGGQGAYKALLNGGVYLFGC